ncbi:lysis protein [Erwiniaceae bacterium BAC15a-03b]|uniref:Lysis protein n=1 Tax=Winslowiella arboricola TaxID=2978220 RepID=A0A9J6PIG3_9GAMM|nr:lysis protein [Winslowiella arboricola]MCU5772842.1 lysis protein [Winslowiella arboricola]MCU5777146.1 lysis protein [Winslowiella arboricola]
MIRLLKHWRLVAGVCLIALIICLTQAVSHYYRQFQQAEKQVMIRQQTIDDMQRRQKSVAALDQKYTKELADAQASIDQLERDLSAGHHRLQLNATCQQRTAPAAASMDDATRARLTDAAQRDYFTLRSRIETSGKMIAGLQHYINEQCLK